MIAWAVVRRGSQTLDIFEDTAKESFLVDQVGAVAEEKCGSAVSGLDAGRLDLH